MILRLLTAAILLGTASCGSSEINVECAETETVRLVEADLGPSGRLFAAKACRCEDYVKDNEADCDLAAEGKHCIPEGEDSTLSEKKFEEFLANPEIVTGTDETFCRTVGVGK